MLCLLWGIAMTRRGCADQSAGSAQGLLTWGAIWQGGVVAANCEGCRGCLQAFGCSCKLTTSCLLTRQTTSMHTL